MINYALIKAFHSLKSVPIYKNLWKELCLHSYVFIAGLSYLPGHHWVSKWDQQQWQHARWSSLWRMSNKTWEKPDGLLKQWHRSLVIRGLQCLERGKTNLFHASIDEWPTETSSKWLIKPSCHVFFYFKNFMFEAKNREAIVALKRCKHTSHVKGCLL